MKTYKKSDIEMHEMHYYGPQFPAVNVKIYAWPCSYKIAQKLNCSEEQAAKAIEFAIEAAQEMFWEEIRDTADLYLGKGTKVYSVGRSGGWAIVEGLPDIDEWDAIQLSKWRRFEKSLKEEVKYRTSLDVIIEDIEANNWYLVGAEKYNFIDFPDGDFACIAEMKQRAIRAGFGPVVRP